MQIGIDASRFHLSNKTGIELYSDEIISHLVSIAKKQSKHDLILYCKKDTDIPDEFEDSKHIIIKRISGKNFWTQVRLTIEIARKKPDLLFIPSHVFPLTKAHKNVITIHDVAFAKYPEVYSAFQRNYLKVTTKIACKRADKIIVPSKATKNDLIEIYKCPKEKIEVISHGIDTDKFPDFEKQDDVEDYVLFIGRLESKKNLIRLLKAFKNFLNLNADWKLILAGPKGSDADRILATIKELGLENSVETPGYISETEKAHLINNAKIFTLPSLTEGFGFPVLEAFHYKIPVLTSHGSATEEIAGNAAYYINPMDTTSIQEGLDKLANNEGLRQELISKMPYRLSKFTWNGAAEKTWNLLTSLL